MKSVLMIGLGRFGLIMARRMTEDGNSVLGIDCSEERANAAAQYLPNVEIMDVTDENALRSLGVEKFDLCVVAIGDNFPVSLEIIVLLKDLGAKYVLARAGRDVHKKLLLRNGADYVVYAEKDMAERLAVTFGNDMIMDYIQLGNDVGIYEIRTPASWVGKTMAQMRIRTTYNLNILAMKRNNKVIPALHPDYAFTAEDGLYVMGNYKDINRALK